MSAAEAERSGDSEFAEGGACARRFAGRSMWVAAFQAVARPGWGPVVVGVDDFEFAQDAMETAQFAGELPRVGPETARFAWETALFSTEISRDARETRT